MQFPAFNRHYLFRLALSMILLGLLVGHASDKAPQRFVHELDAIIYDYRLRLTMPNTVDERIVILDIDEKSLAEEGHWPWRRDRLALLVTKLFNTHGIAVLGFDMVFAEPDESSGLKVLTELGRQQLKDIPRYHAALSTLRPRLDFDRLFADALKGRLAVLGYYVSERDEGSEIQVSGVLPTPSLPAGTFAGKSVDFVSFNSYGANLPELQAAAAAAGHFTAPPDPDGLLRRVPMLVEYDGAYYEALPVAVVRALLGFPVIAPAYELSGATKDYAGFEWLELKGEALNVRIPIDNRVSTLIPYRGKRGSFKYISATDVLHDRIDPESLQGRVALLGATAPGLMDLRATPVGTVFPGVEIHANLIAGMLDQTLKHKPGYVLAVDVTLLLITGLALALLIPVLSPLATTLLTFGIVSLVLVVNVTAWHYAHIVLPAAAGLLLILGLYVLNMSYGYFIESKAKRQITQMFGRYVSPQLVDEMSRNPGMVSMAGDSREMTVLFADVRDFTALAERMEPKLLSALMNEFLTALTQVIYKHRGTIDKYIGDCIMAFWGAPVRDTEHARNAVLAGLEMQQVLRALAPDFEKRGWPEIKMGTGINTGRMSVGNMGSHIRVAYTVMGDAVNLAARLEALTRHYGVHILVGEATQQSLPELVFREVDRVRVKGKGEPSGIYEPIGHAGRMSAADEEELQRYRQALACYRMQDWEQAEQQFRHLRTFAPHCRLYEIYLERIHAFRAHPPGPNWDGVHVFEAK